MSHIFELPNRFTVDEDLHDRQRSIFVDTAAAVLADMPIDEPEQRLNTEYALQVYPYVNDNDFPLRSSADSDAIDHATTLVDAEHYFDKKTADYVRTVLLRTTRHLGVTSLDEVRRLKQNASHSREA